MANKKISQLTEVGNVGAGDLFAVSVPAGGPYITKSCEPKTIATYALNPVPSDIPTIGFTGTQNVFFDKSNWIDTTAAAGDAGTHAYIMVNKGNGQLTTGSGIANPVGGDNMGNCTATTELKMQGYDIINANEIYFGGTSGDDYAVIDYSYYAGSPQLTILKIRSDDLTLSGTRHVNISGQALDLASTPISGNVTITGGDLEIDPGNKLIVNEISTYTMAEADDPAILSISGSARFFTWETDAPLAGSGDVDWKDSNIQFDSTSSVINYYFKNVRDGQTMTMYVQNTHASTSFTPTFTNESDWGNGLGGNDYYAPPVPVLWSFPTGDTVAAMKEPPLLAAGTTNVYTFVNIKTGIFAAAITGYVY